MSTSSFPVIKLFSIFVKQLSKPMASYIKRKSKQNYWVRTYLCMPPAQFYHRCDVKLRIWVSGARPGHKYKIPPLSEDMAIDQGADLLGEFFIFSVAAGLLSLEYYRQSVNAAKKDAQQDLSLSGLTKDVKTLRSKVQEQTSDIDELIRLVEVMQNKRIGRHDDRPLIKP